MKRCISKIISTLLIIILLLPLLPTASAAKNNTPYIFNYDSDNAYWHRSPHRYSYISSDGTLNSGYIPAMYRLESENTIFPAYCCDVLYSISKSDMNYRRINLEDAGYYSAANAGKIRAVLANGYWPGRSNLDTIAEKADADGLTAAEALSATQCAIWHFANSNSLKDVYTNTMPVSKAGIYDTVTVDPTEAASEGTQTRIQNVYNYLCSLSPLSAETVIWSIENDHVVLTAEKSLNSIDVTVLFELKGSYEGASSVMLTAELQSNGKAIDSASYSVLDDELSKTPDGYYCVSFKDVSTEFITAGASVILQLSGTQNVSDGAYFYKPVGERESAQCFVGYGSGETPFESTKAVSIPSDTASLSLYKFDETKGYNFPVSGAEFTLYAKINGSENLFLCPGDNPKTTDKNGNITWSGLIAADNVEYVCKETSAPSGYVVKADEIINFTNGTAEASNKRDLTNLSITKSVSGNSTCEEFSFALELDYSNAPLSKHTDLTREYSKITASVFSADTTASAELVFKNDNGIMKAVFNLSAGETLCIPNLPVGTAYTVYEAAPNGIKAESMKPLNINGTIYVPTQSEFTGILEGSSDNAVRFENIEYSKTNLTFTGLKYLDNAPSAEVFCFSLFSIHDGSTVLIEEITNDQHGKFKFSALEFDTPGTYNYEICETSQKDGYTLDDTLYTAVVEIAQDDTKRELYVKSCSIYADGKAVNDIVFNNETLKTTKTTEAPPHTGDNSLIHLWQMLCAISATGIVGVVAAIILTNKKRQ